MLIDKDFWCAHATWACGVRHGNLVSLAGANLIFTGLGMTGEHSVTEIWGLNHQFSMAALFLRGRHHRRTDIIPRP